jgi:hypothetical protein
VDLGQESQAGLAAERAAAAAGIVLVTGLGAVPDDAGQFGDEGGEGLGQSASVSRSLRTNRP